MKRIRRLSILFVLLVAFAALPVLTLFVSASSEYDYSYPSANFTSEIYPDEFLLENLSGLTLLDEERAFLREEWGALLRYNSSIPTYTVKTEFSGNTLTVTAQKYDYVAENGTIVVWKPYEAELLGEVKKFGAAPYTAVFENVSETASDSVSVRYSAEFSISEDTVNELLNYSYNGAISLKEHIINKKEEYEAYLDHLDRYNEYLAALALYNEYLSEYRIYVEEYARYEEYLSDLEEYEEKTAEFRNYVIAREKYFLDLAKYTEYLAYAEQNQDKIDAYESYQEKYDTVLAQLDVIKRTKTPISVTNAPDRTVYGAIMGDTVTTVIDRKGDIVNVLKADGAVVDLAGEATENLRVLLTEFFDIKSVEGQYKYYITNYEAFRDNFINLLRALENLYCVSGVRGTMIEQGKYEKYVVLVAQLYYVANALSDEPIASLDGSYYYDSNFVIGMTYNEDYKRISPMAALEEQYFVTDTDSAEPLSGGFPTAPPKPDFLTVTEPVMPEPVAAPVMPDEVVMPTPPVPVSKPDEISKPAKVLEYIPTKTVLDIVSALDDGRISPREAYTGGSISTFGDITVTKSLKNSGKATVTYYDKEFNTSEEKFVLYTVTVDESTAADYLGTVPYKAEDSEFVYYHSGWTDEYGNPLDLSSVSGDIAAYPSFCGEEQTYEIYWVLPDGTVYNDNPGALDLPESEYYEFDYGWGEPVFDTDAGTKTFYAAYLTDKPLVTTPYGTLKVTRLGSVFSFSQSAGTDTVNISNLLDRAAGVSGISMRASGGAILNFSIAETLALKRAGVQTLTVKNDKRISVEAYDADGNPITSLELSLSVPFVSRDPSHLAVSYTADDGRAVVRHKISEDGALAVFGARTGIYYTVRTEYSLSAPTLLDGVVIKLSHSSAEAGETVGVTVTAPEGIKIERIYVKENIQGGEVLDVKNSSFSMPEYDVIVGVEYKKLSYTVSFISDGRALVTKKYNYGDTVVIPEDPSKASGDRFSYVFKGWSPEVSETVTGNATYSAVYEAVPIAKDDKDNDRMTPTVLKLVLLATVGLSCIVFIVIPSTVITLTVKKRRKKHIFKLK